MDAKKFGAFIADIRKENQMTQAELAKKLGVTDKAVSKWERGIGFPDINTIEPLADALGVSVLELMKSEKIDNPSITQEEASEALTNTFDLVDSHKKLEKNVVVFFSLWAFSFLLFLLFIDNMEKWMAAFVFGTSAAVMVGSGYHWRKNREDTESTKIYRTILIFAAAAAVSSGMAVLPISFVEQYGEWILLLIYILGLIGSVRNMIQIISKKGTVGKGRFVLRVVTLLFVVCIWGGGILSRINAIQSIGEKNRMNAVKQYAELLLEKDYDIGEESIKESSCKYVKATDETQPYYTVSFTYRAPGENIDKTCSYDIVVNSNLTFIAQ